MSFSERYIPLEGVNVDLAAPLLPSTKAVFIKNLVYALSDSSDSTKSKGSDTGLFKTYQSNQPYIKDFVLPGGDNYCIGALSSKETRQVFAWIYNSLGNHTLYVLNGYDQTMNVLLQGPQLNLQLNPEYFIHYGGSNAWVLYITNADTGEKKIKTFLTWTDDFNPQRFTCVQDAIDTNGFSDAQFQYFSGDYDHDAFINAGVTPDQECIQIEEVDITDESQKKNNNLLFNTWQFRTRYIDIWGRPSEYSIISDLYVPGLNDCLSSSSNISRCIDLTFNTPPPNVDKVEIAYRNCNELQWYSADTLDLYVGSNLGEWWQRNRNPGITYNSDGSKIIYRFCADHECSPISPALTTRLFNPIPNRSVSAAPIGKTQSYSNNEYGFNPLSHSLLEKITVTVKPPDTPAQQLQARNITVYIPIFNQFKQNYQQVFPDAPGYAWGDNNPGHGGAKAYSQYFVNTDQRGFCGYLVGGPSAISTQVYVAANGDLVDDPDFQGINISALQFNGSGVTFQKFTFSNIPPGRYIFRLASHVSNPDTDVWYRNTSTTVLGVFGLYSGQKLPVFSASHYTQELLIDVCNGDYDTFSSGAMMVIGDLAAYRNAAFNSSKQYSKAVCGYIRESPEGEPMELMMVNPYQLQTDHNGFYWAATYGNPDLHSVPRQFSFLNKCVPVQVNKNYDFQSDFGLVFENINITSIDGNRFSDYSITPCNRIVITGKLTVQGTNIGIPGVDVALTRGQSSTTDSNGNFTIIAHDDMRVNPRKDKLIITNGSCRYYSEGQICITPIDITIYRCVSCAPSRAMDIGNTLLLSDFLQRGLLSGGTYAVGIAGKDFLDRSQFVQDLGYITIPSVQETKIFSPSTVVFNIDPSAEFPDNIRYIVPYISLETTLEDYITWIVDSFELVDNTGQVNASNPTQIKIYYQSLIEFNKQNNYNTTDDWAFINTGTPDNPLNTPYTTDNVTFLVNGDGKFFDKSITSRVKYAQDGQYFLINYTNDLKDLKPNAIIRLFRPRQCEVQELMYEICHPIKIINKKAEENSFTLNAFDTYYLSREIPVPTVQQDGEETETVLETRIFAYPFEHDSPSDLWGKGCKNIGRFNVKNPYEAIIYKQDEIALSGSFSENGYVNYLNYFEDGYSALNIPSRKYSFDKTNINGIVSVIPQIGVVMVVGTLNNFTVGFNDNLLRATASGIQLPSEADTFGQPNINPLDNYGCRLFDKNSIYEYEGRVQWVDSTKACIAQNAFSQAEDISKYSCESYVRDKIKEVFLYNKQNGNKRYFVGTANVLNKEYILTDKIIGDSSYFNNLRDKDVATQETFCFDIFSKMFKGWVSYTPEMYSTLMGELNNQQLFSFKNGVPYYHYTTITNNVSWGSFYGMPAERVIEIVVNADNVKKKKILFTQVYSHHLYFVDRILTEANQESWIPVEYWKQGDYFWAAPFLCDLNTPPDPNRALATGANKLTDGDVLYGLWMKVRFVGVPEDNTKYTELTGFTIDVIPEEKSGA